jgi:sulfonate transport system substrate-binding protein
MNALTHCRHAWRDPVRRFAVLSMSILALLFMLGTGAAQAAQPAEIRLDYAYYSYYSPSSLVLKHFGWAEQEFAKQGIKVKWVLSAGSNRALEYLNSGSVDFASTAGLAALLSRANGNPVKSVYIFSKPEWTALVVPANSKIKSVRDLKGKKIAATKGTDPYLFLLRSLNQAGLSRSDIEHVSLQHADGRTALEQGRVDAWAGLDPMMASAELESGARLLYRNVTFNTYGFLNTTDTFSQKSPDLVRRVIGLYEQARRWLLANPEAGAALLAEAAGISPNVAKLQLSRNDFSKPVPGTEQIQALQAAVPILREEALVKPDVDLAQAILQLLDSSHARAVVH